MIILRVRIPVVTRKFPTRPELGTLGVRTCRTSGTELGHRAWSQHNNKNKNKYYNNKKHDNDNN